MQLTSIRLRWLIVSFFAGFSATFVHAQTAMQAQRFVTIGTGGVTGVYYPVGGAICRLLNAGRAEHQTRCVIDSTGGSVFNVNALRQNDIDFGLVQSDVHYHAWRGEREFASDPHRNLRSVMALHVEAFTVLARADANIVDFIDLTGKRVNIGNPDSGQRATLVNWLTAQGKTTEVFARTSHLTATEMTTAMCDDQVDAIIYVVGHPSGAIHEATGVCESRLVHVRGQALDALVRQFPYYAPTQIGGGIYPNNPQSTQTFGVIATLMTMEDTPDELVYLLVKSVFERLDSFRSMHPALADLQPENMVLDGMSAPLHEGALRYYREQGLLP